MQMADELGWHTVALDHRQPDDLLLPDFEFEIT